MQVMGDWAKGEFIAAGQTAGQGIWLHRRCPGGYVMGGDVFVFPKIDDPAQQAAQDKMATLMLAPDDAARVQQEEGLGAGPARRRRLGHGRVRAEGHGGAARSRASRSRAPTSCPRPTWSARPRT